MPFQPKDDVRSGHSPLPRPDISLHASFIQANDASQLFDEISKELDLNQDRVLILGTMRETKRLVDFRGDSGTFYRYSGRTREAKPWTPLLNLLRAKVSEACATDFNACLCNYYSDGSVGMGWHADDEPELGARPTIASISLGAPRTFRLRYKRNWRPAESPPAWQFELQSGDLLVMRGDTQLFYEHEIPIQKKVTAPRLNLTFRKIVG